jgi:hypothetical protein
VVVTLVVFSNPNSVTDEPFDRAAEAFVEIGYETGVDMARACDLVDQLGAEKPELEVLGYELSEFCRSRSGLTRERDATRDVGSFETLLLKNPSANLPTDHAFEGGRGKVSHADVLHSWPNALSER